jgi:hypothetical protein
VDLGSSEVWNIGGVEDWNYLPDVISIVYFTKKRIFVKNKLHI